MKAGLEIHQRICDRKLFCNCDALMVDDEVVREVDRVLHPVAGEGGEVDPAVLFESDRSKKFRYMVRHGDSCLVETDSEPPGEVNQEALVTALRVAKHLRMFIPDELHVMRKTVIDGSNTGGFQRTMVVGLGTKESVIKTSEGPVRVKDLELEEESARIMNRSKTEDIYDLAGLGVPLIEIGTHADIKSPLQAREVALKLGELLRLTGKAQRGLGTIRQDVNVSIEGGARVEIKGFQDVNEMPRLIENEVKRQQSLIELSKELTGYELRRVNVTKFFQDSDSRVTKGKEKILSLVLPGFKGLLKRELCPGLTLGAELAGYARSQGVKGLIHSDEDLSKYKLTDEFALARNELGLKENDLLLIVAGPEELVNKAVSVVSERVYLLNDRVPEETRVASDSVSVYARPLPGGARMYPETDVPLIKVTKQLLKSLEEVESLESREKELKGLGLSDELIDELKLNPKLGLFRSLVKTGVDPVIIARLLITVPKEVNKREGVFIELPDEAFEMIIDYFKQGLIARDAFPDILLKMDQEGVSERLLDEFKQLSNVELGKIIKKVISKKKGLTVKQYMGLVMKEVGGRASGARVIKLLNDCV